MPLNNVFTEKDVSDIIDLLNIMSENGCDTEYNIDYALENMIRMLKDEISGFTIKCNNVRIRIDKKINHFNIQVEPI